MYDPIEVDISKSLLRDLTKQCKNRNIPIALIGGWASYFYVNQTYRRAFGRDYMGSRDIDICFKHDKEKEFLELIKEMGFMKNGYKFRWEKIYNRETKQFLTQEEAKKEEIFNLIYIFLDLFCDQETKHLECWALEPLKDIKIIIIEDFSLSDIDTLITLKCHAIFARDKADKENKDACDLYALINYSSQPIPLNKLLGEAIDKILRRPDLIYSIAQHVLLDVGKQNIVEHTLRSFKGYFKNLNDSKVI